jgi:hypothetical protein
MTKKLFAFGRLHEEKNLRFVDIVKVTRPETAKDEKYDILSVLVIMPESVARFSSDMLRQGIIDYTNLGIINIIDDKNNVLGFKYWIPDKEYMDPKFEPELRAFYNQINPFIVKMNKAQLPFAILKTLVPDSLMNFGMITCAAQLLNPENNVVPEPESVVEIRYFRNMAEKIWEKYRAYTDTKISNLHTPLVNGTDPYGLKMKFIDQIALLMTDQQPVQAQIKWSWQQTGAFNYVSSHLKKWDEEHIFWDLLNPIHPEVENKDE